MGALDLFEEQLRAWGLGVSPDEKRLLSGFAELLSGYREANVIGARTYEEVLLDHVLDSLSCLLFAPLRKAGALVDVGSGGGLPGIPLKICLRDLEVTLVESTGKKANFLNLVAEELALPGLRVVNARAEEIGRNARHRDAYGCATARAVASLPVLLEYCVPLLRVGAYFVAMKGKPEPGEISAGEAAARELGAKMSERIEVPMLPEIGDKRRSLIVYQKVSGTPARYPRRVGVPSKKPLGRRV